MEVKRALRVAVVDDDDDFLSVATELVREAGGVPVPLSRLEDALEVVTRAEVDAVITDYRLSNGAGGDLVVKACHAGRRIPVAVMSVVNSAEIALRLVRLGADDYLLKPSSAAELLPRIRTFLDAALLDREARIVGELSQGGPEAAVELLRASPALKPLLNELPRAARSGANVLVVGESGTGKELAARAVHELSRRAEGPFVAVDCGAIPENLLENELFGHRKGAYSDARDDRDGLVQKADGGTFFLDEIGELPLTMQAKLLRFMQSREYRRLGDAKTSRADVRFVAATHRDLHAAVAGGTFRQDLFYRMNVITLRLPPLRERPADIPVLAVGFLHRYATEFQSPALSISRDALDALCRQPWPGNVRELENTVQRAVAMATAPVIDAFDFSSATHPEGAPASEPAAVDPGAASGFHQRKQELVDRFERDYARELVRRHAGNLSAAAREAGLDRKSLARLLTRHRLDVPSIIAKS